MRALEIVDNQAFTDSLSLQEREWLSTFVRSDERGRDVVECIVRKKDVVAKSEEVVRQLWLHRLTTQYHYPVSQLAVEYPITFGRDSSKRADIVIYDPDRPAVPYVMIEVKQAKMKDGKEQLRSYTHAASGLPAGSQLASKPAPRRVCIRSPPSELVDDCCTPDTSKVRSALLG